MLHSWYLKTNEEFQEELSLGNKWPSGTIGEDFLLAAFVSFLDCEDIWKDEF